MNIRISSFCFKRADKYQTFSPVILFLNWYYYTLSWNSQILACVTDATNPLVKSVSEPALKSLFWAPSLYQDLTMCHHWPVKKAIVDLPIRLKGNSNLRYGNSLSLMGPQNKDLGTSLQILLFGVWKHYFATQATENRTPSRNRICVSRWSWPKAVL